MGLKVRKIVKNNDFQEIFTNTVNNHTEYTSRQNATGSVLRNFDEVLRLRYFNWQPFLAEAWPI